MVQEKKKLTFNPDAMTVRDLKYAARDLRSLLEAYKRDPEGSGEAVIDWVWTLNNKWEVD